MSRYFYAGAPFRPGTSLPDNVSGNCEHRHRTAQAAQACIDRHQAEMARLGGVSDRVLMMCLDGDRYRHHEIAADGQPVVLDRDVDVEAALVDILIHRLRVIGGSLPADTAHAEADRALLDYIDNDRVRAAYEAVIARLA